MIPISAFKVELLSPDTVYKDRLLSPQRRGDAEKKLRMVNMKFDVPASSPGQTRSEQRALRFFSPQRHGDTERFGKMSSRDHRDSLRCPFTAEARRRGEKAKNGKHEI
jgi:hypothetical protein